ncbi:hypothetical protein OIU84_024918 [Salix udensis]|uniref:Glycosyltransferase family 92 protein n=1 Tax=Salix udensis TaxID=889485 RepID=A0AAD6KJR0_9ROSI|nr:hypothetical protein OIU84_024918 [Salix udensis]
MAQEIVRCKTPLSILGTPQMVNSSIKASIRVKGRGTLHSIARPGFRSKPHPGTPERKPHEMCICTMLRNQARFLREWVMYHAQIGVQSWYIYDNNSDDDIDDVMESLVNAGLNISRRVWPWIKTQEAGFAHCALRARESCEWVGFIDVDEYFYSPLGLSLHDVISNQSDSGNDVAEIRTSCYSFGPSGAQTCAATRSDGRVYLPARSTGETQEYSETGSIEFHADQCGAPFSSERGIQVCKC